jgi:2-polyprenyl-3-methyl-5-hydroxy-6-metoxy-1,4-benzoquinol methylase
MSHQPFREANRLSWNEAIQARNRHKGDDATFFREGGNTLDPEERAFLGDMAGVSVVHLQCNCGEDTLSLAQLGAIATGVDISDTAIETARSLSQSCAIPATFHRMDVYDWLEQAAQANRHFDVVFCSYGSVIWLPDLASWARGIATILKPGGRFVLLEMHPVLLMFEHDWTLAFPYSSEGKVLTMQEGMGDIMNHPSGQLQDVEEYINPHPTYEFAWGIGEVVMALLGAGLSLAALKEYQYAYTNDAYERMQRSSGGQWLLPAGMPNLPLRYGVLALKSARSQ